MKITIPAQNPSKDSNIYKPFHAAHPEIIIYVLLFIISFVIYLPALNFDFVWDDYARITRNPYTRSGLSLKNIAWAFTFHGDTNYWHPLTHISHMLDVQLFGLNAAGHHLSNIVIHTASSLLLFHTLRLMTRSLWKSAFVAALFVAHPLNIESVAWISERTNVLSTFFLFLTLLTYYSYTQKKSLPRYLLVLLIFELGLLSKPMLVTVPLLLLLLDFWPLGRYQEKAREDITDEKKSHFFPILFSRPFYKLLIEKIPLGALSLLSYLITTLSLYSAKLDASLFIATSHSPLSLRLANISVSYVKYIIKLILPLNLACFYPYPSSIPFWQSAGSALLLVLITLFFIRIHREKPYHLTGWLWFCITLLPVSGIIQIGRWPQIADRFAYVPFIGLFIIIAWGIPDILKQGSRRLILLVYASIIVLISSASVHNLPFWKNDITLFSHAYEVTKDNGTIADLLSRVLTNQGRNLQLEGKLDEAEQKLFDAIRIFPGNKNSYNTLGINYRLKNDPRKALTNFLKALELDPEFAIAHLNTGIILMENAFIEDAIFHFQEAVRLDPKDATAREKLAEALSLESKTNPMK